MEQLDIPLKTIFKVFITGFVFYILFLAREVLIWTFFALIISLLLDPAINFLRWMRFPKMVAVILVYLSIFGLLGFVIYLVAPVFALEIQQLLMQVPNYFERINPVLKELGVNVARDFDSFSTAFIEGLKESSNSIFRAITVFFGGLASALTIFTLAFFISLEDRAVERSLSLLVPRKYQEYSMRLFEKVQFQVSGWFGARIIACFFVWITSFTVFFLLDVKYAFILSLISGLLNFVPFIGPTITAVLVFVSVGTFQSWIVALYVIIFLTVIQEIENKFVTPFLMKKFVDLPPVLVLLSILIGGTVFGFLGAIFLGPIAGIAYEFTKEFLEKKRKRELEDS